VRLPSLVLAAVLAAGASLGAAPPDVKIAPWLAARFAGGTEESFLVLFDDDAGTARTLLGAHGRKAVYEALTQHARASQASLRAALTAQGIAFRPLYLVNGLAPLVDALDVLQKLSPFYHYAVGDPLREGISFAHMAVLVAIAVVATALAPWFFARRDVAT